MTTDREPARKDREQPLAACAACGRERPCYYARTARPLCRTCYRRENIGRWNISRWQRPVAICADCGRQGPARFADTSHPLCSRCYRRRQPKRPSKPPPLAVCERCGRERPCRRTAAGELVCSGCRRGDYERAWVPPIVHCSTCDQDAPGHGAGGDRPICRSCRRRELAAKRTEPYRRPLARCSGCGRERPCYFATSAHPVCQTCRWRGWAPPTATCTICGRDRPCHHASSDHAICQSCTKRVREPVERCLTCGELRHIHRRVHGRAECWACAMARTRERIDCHSCGQTRRPAATDRLRCERCAGEPVLHECRSCHAQPNIYDQGLCAACGLAARLQQLRAEAIPDVLAQLEPYLAVLADTPDPWSTICWMRDRPGYQILRQLAAGTIGLSHEALDTALGDVRAISHLRDALIAARVLPRRAEQAASFRRAADRLLAGVSDGAERTQLRGFASWRQHQRLLGRERRHQTTRNSGRHELRRLRAATQLARWAHDRGHSLQTLDQHQLDRWLAPGPGARRDVADYLEWAVRAGYRDPLSVPPSATRRHTQQLPTEARQALVRQLLDDEAIDLRDRVGGLLVLLLAQPASRLTMLTTDHIAKPDHRVTIQLGREPLELPERIGQLATGLAQPTSTATDPGPRWLFAGSRRDSPLSEAQFRRRLNRLGIPTLAARTGALLNLATTLPPAILADLLGLSEGNAANWSQLAASDWAAYAAHRHKPSSPAPPPAFHTHD